MAPIGLPPASAPPASRACLTRVLYSRYDSYRNKSNARGTEASCASSRPRTRGPHPGGDPPRHGRGVASLSIPRWHARPAVSVPTVYRHFGTKRAPHGGDLPVRAQRAGVNEPPSPRSIDELQGDVRVVRRAAWTRSTISRARPWPARPRPRRRRASMPARLECRARWCDSIRAQARESRSRPDRASLAVLPISSALRMWQRPSGRSVEEVADDIDWSIRAAGAQPGKER